MNKMLMFCGIIFIIVGLIFAISDYVLTGCILFADGGILIFLAMLVENNVQQK